MKPCSRCRRHLLSAASPCPFCGQDNRTVGEGSALALGLGLALAGPLGCSTGDKNTESSTNTPSTDGTNTQTTQTTQTTQATDTFDDGGSYYAGPPTDSAVTLDTSTTTSTSTATDTETTTGTGTATSMSTTSDDSLSDSGGSYYAGPSSDSDFVWGASDPAKR